MLNRERSPEQPALPELRRPVVDAPGQLLTLAQQADGWIESYRRNEVYWLNTQVEELERKLRWRTLVLSSSIALITVAAAGAILFLLLPLQHRPELAAAALVKRPILAAPIAEAVGLQVTPPAPVQAATQAALRKPAVQPPLPERLLDDEPHAESAPRPPAPEHDGVGSAELPIERTDRHTVPTAETRALSPLPPMRVDDQTDTSARVRTLRAVLFDIKQQMWAHPEAGDNE